MSRFEKLSKLKTEVHGVGVHAVVRRRDNPEYKQFSAYIPVLMYRKLKGHLGSNEIELSEAVEQALAAWMEKHGA